MTEGKQLYDYLLTNVAQYNFDIFTMYKGDPKEVEYVLVKATNSQQVTYKDALDMQHTDDFAVTVIICNTLSTNVPRDNTLCLKYYLILISRRLVLAPFLIKKNYMFTFQSCLPEVGNWEDFR